MLFKLACILFIVSQITCYAHPTSLVEKLMLHDENTNEPQIYLENVEDFLSEVKPDWLHKLMNDEETVQTFKRQLRLKKPRRPALRRMKVKFRGKVTTLEEFLSLLPKIRNGK